MRWNEHSHLEGKHAFLSASQGAWINYNDSKLADVYLAMKAKEKGTELHELASSCIKNRIPLAKRKQAIFMFVNDAIGHHMESEKVLYYSEYSFGTADAISLEHRDGNVPLLRIFDLKTGRTPVNKMRQLDIYAALFCLEYRYSPYDIEIEQRIYQNGSTLIDTADPDNIRDIMDKIVRFNQIIQELEE